MRLRGERTAHGTTLLAELLLSDENSASAAWGLVTQTRRYSLGSLGVVAKQTKGRALGCTARETGGRSVGSADAFSRVVRSLAGPHFREQHFSVEADG